MLLGEMYLTGTRSEKVITLPFWDEDCRGAQYKYVRIHVKSDMTSDEVAKELLDGIEQLLKLTQPTVAPVVTPQISSENIPLI